MNRRTVLKGGIVMAFTSHTAVAAVDVPADPILDAIAAYKRGWDAFLAAPDDEAENLHHLWKEPHTVLCNWSTPALTREGAMAALTLAIEEDDTGNSYVTGPMIKAAFSYFKREDLA